MYAVVGCSRCQSLWIVEGEPETTTCPRCRKRHRFGRLKKFVATEHKDEAREVRAAMLAAKQGHEDAYEELDSVADMEAILEDVGIEDGEYLLEKGVDAGAVADAGAAATESRPRTSRRDRVLEALRELDEPSEAAVLEYATERGVPASYVRNALEKLSRRGEITETPEGYRLL